MKDSKFGLTFLIFLSPPAGSPRRWHGDGLNSVVCTWYGFTVHLSDYFQYSSDFSSALTLCTNTHTHTHTHSHMNMNMNMNMNMTHMQYCGPSELLACFSPLLACRGGRVHWLGGIVEAQQADLVRGRGRGRGMGKG